MPGPYTATDQSFCRFCYLPIRQTRRMREGWVSPEPFWTLVVPPPGLLLGDRPHEPLKGLTASIYRPTGGSTSNGGLSSRVDKVTICGDGWKGRTFPELCIARPDSPPVRLTIRRIGGEWVRHAEPILPDRRHAMFGGAFVYTPDSRFREGTGSDGAVRLHDRFE